MNEKNDTISGLRKEVSTLTQDKAQLESDFKRLTRKTERSSKISASSEAAYAERLQTYVRSSEELQAKVVELEARQESSRGAEASLGQEKPNPNPNPNPNWR